METVQMMSFESVTRIHLILLKLTAILPFEDRTYSFYGSKTLLVLNYTCLMIHLTMFSCYSIRSLYRGYFDVGNAAEIIALIGVIWRFVYLHRHRFQFLTLVKSFEDIWYHLELSEKIHVSHFTKKSVRISWIYMIIMGSLGSFYVLASYFMHSSESNANEAPSRMLPYRFYVDVEETPWFEIVPALQIIVISTVSIICAAVDTVAPFLSMMICGYLKLLQIRLQEMAEIVDENHSSEKIGPKSNQNDFRTKFVSCIQYHQRILIFCADIEKLTRSVSMSAILGSLYNMSLVGIQLIGNDPDRFKYITFFSMCLIQFFVYQWASDHLIDQSTAVANAAYLIPPHKNMGDTEKLIVLIIMRSQKSVHLTAGGLINLSMERFGSMMTSAFSFFTVLRRFNL